MTRRLLGALTSGLVMFAIAFSMLTLHEKAQAAARAEGKPVRLSPTDTSPTPPCPSRDQCCPCGWWCDCILGTRVYYGSNGEHYHEGGMEPSCKKKQTHMHHDIRPAIRELVSSIP